MWTAQCWLLAHKLHMMSNSACQSEWLHVDELIQAHIQIMSWVSAMSEYRSCMKLYVAPSTTMTDQLKACLHCLPWYTERSGSLQKQQVTMCASISIVFAHSIFHTCHSLVTAIHTHSLSISETQFLFEIMVSGWPKQGIHTRKCSHASVGFAKAGPNYGMCIWCLIDKN